MFNQNTVGSYFTEADHTVPTGAGNVSFIAGLVGFTSRVKQDQLPGLKGNTAQTCDTSNIANVLARSTGQENLHTGMIYHPNKHKMG